MCGIAGLFGNGECLASKRIVASIVQDQIPRGPDNQSVSVFGEPGRCAVLGHDRLGILDLSSSANQPMASSDGRCHIVFNGEIYNYRDLRSELTSTGAAFRTESDTEVLLAALRQWGPDALNRCNGMFAYAMYDQQEHRLSLGRDRFGVKPVYYILHSGQFYFASTGRALASHLKLGPNLEYVSRGLCYGVYEDDGEISQYEGLRSLPPGHILEVTARGNAQPTVRATRYYDLAVRAGHLRQELSGSSPRLLQERFRGTLEDAVSLRLMADVPVGVSISGGLDSSSVASLAISQVSRLTGFCYGSPGEPSSEGPLVAELAAQKSLDVHYAWETGGMNVIDAFWRTLEAQDAPYLNGSVVAQNVVFQVARSCGFKVLLGGQGGDEVLMGYNKFRLLQLRSLLRGRQWLALMHVAIGLVPVVVAMRQHMASLRWHSTRYRRSGGARHRLILPPPAPLALGACASDQLWQRQLLDIVKASLPTLLRYEDRNSMGNSVESRLPFLDYRVVELGLALPDDAKLRDGWGKWILRAIMRGELPEAIRMNKAKRGFDVNQEAWLGSGLGAAIRERLQSRRAAISPFLPPGAPIDVLYSDGALGSPGSALGEAISLLWLAQRT
jgi:asparagine synthase (glutamine-hydrolysing)